MQFVVCCDMAEIQYGCCHCGCGEKTKISDRDHKRDGHIKGQPHKYIAGHQCRKSPVEYIVVEHIVDEKIWLCWEWQRYVRPDGYGSHNHPVSKKTVSSHRYYYEKHKGLIPDGYDIDHLCRNHKCVNPDHLEAVTRRENLIRGQGLLDNFNGKTRWDKEGEREKQTELFRSGQASYVRSFRGKKND